MEKSFLERHKSHLELGGFWDEERKQTIIFLIESRYKKEIIQEWYVNDIVLNGDKFLFNWKKRHKKLTDKEVKDRYGI